MRPLPIPKTASHVVKNFRVRELEGLMNHLRLYGPLPTRSEAVISSTEGPQNTISEPSIVLPNPFIPRKNPKTGKWRGPKYSLRRQADLVKKGQTTNNLNIIPPGTKLFAMELRLKNLQASLSPSDATVFANFINPQANQSVAIGTSSEGRSGDKGAKHATENGDPTAKFQRHFAALETRIRENKEKLVKLEEDFEQRRSQHELDELAAFEKNETDADRRDRRRRQDEYAILEGQISDARRQVDRAEKRLQKTQEAQEVLNAEQARDKLWENPLWVGEVKKKTTKGQDLGIRLYAGKKKMFKGHRWEKEKAKKLRRQSILMRDMKKRIARYKTVSLDCFGCLLLRVC